jgi:hypothetical protein
VARPTPQGTAHARGLALVAVLALALAGCGAAGPPGGVTLITLEPALTAEAPVDASASSGVAAPPPSATALPDADAAAGAVRAFATTIRDPALAYSVTATLVERYAADTVKTVFEASVSGADYRGTAKAHGKTVGFAYVDEQGWAKPPDQPWYHLAVHQLQADDAVRPWETLCWLNDLAYSGRPEAPADGFAFICPAGYTFQNRRLRSVGAHGRVDALVLVVDAAGAPVSLHVEGEQAAPNGEATPFTLDARFNDVGKPVTIKAP